MDEISMGTSGKCHSTTRCLKSQKLNGTVLNELLVPVLAAEFLCFLGDFLSEEPCCESHVAVTAVSPD